MSAAPRELVKTEEDTEVVGIADSFFNFFQSSSKLNEDSARPVRRGNLRGTSYSRK
jgi:hypothetical protein